MKQLQPHFADNFSDEAKARLSKANKLFTALRFSSSDDGITDDWRIERLAENDNHPPHREDGEDDASYFIRLREMWGKGRQVLETHESWKAKHRNGLYEYDYKNRIRQQLKALLNSGFLREDYIDTGMPEEDCEHARKELEKEGYGSLLKEVEGTVWKYALLTRHLGKGQCMLCDAANVGYYISNMYEKLSWEDVEAFFRFDTYLQLVYAEMENVGQHADMKVVDDEVEVKMTEDEEFTLRERLVFFLSVLGLYNDKKYTNLSNLAKFVAELCNDQKGIGPFLSKMKKPESAAANAKAARRVATMLKNIIPKEYQNDKHLKINKLIESMKLDFPDNEDE